MKLSADQHVAYLPRAAVSGPAPAIAKPLHARPAPPPAPATMPTTAGSPRAVDAGAFVETTTAVQAARVHRNRQLAAHSLAHIKRTIETLEADNASLKSKDATLDAQLKDLLGKAAAQREH